MKLLIFCSFFALSFACDFGFKEKAKELISLNFIQSKGFDNFNSLKITFPKLDEVFDCVSRGDLVSVEVFYRYKKEKGETKEDWEKIKTQTLTYNKFGSSLNSFYVFGPNQNEDKVRPCETVEIRLKAKPSGTNGRPKNLRLKNFRFGPGLVTGLTVGDITNATASVDFVDKSQGQSCAESYEVETTDEEGLGEDQEPLETNEGTVMVENLSACHEHEVKVSPIFEGKSGIPVKTSFKTFPGPEMAQVNFEDELIIIDPFEMQSCMDKITYLLTFEGSMIDKTEAVFKEGVSFDVLEEEKITKEDIKMQMTNQGILKPCANYKMSLKLKTMKTDGTFFEMDKLTLDIVTDNDRNMHYQSETICQRQARAQESDDRSVEDILALDPPKTTEDSEDPRILGEIDASANGYSSDSEDKSRIGDTTTDQVVKNSGTDTVALVVCLLLLVVLVASIAFFVHRRNKRQEVFKYPESKFTSLPTKETNGKVEIYEIPGATENAKFSNSAEIFVNDNDIVKNQA